MADEKTRVETVTENIEAVIDMRGEEAFDHIASVCLQDISVSLALLVDAGSTDNSDNSGT